MLELMILKSIIIICKHQTAETTETIVTNTEHYDSLLQKL
jgi:hypothetical protein